MQVMPFAARAKAKGAASDTAHQSPVPGFGEKYFSNFSETFSHDFASGGEGLFAVMFGQIRANATPPRLSAVCRQGNSIDGSPLPLVAG